MTNINFYPVGDTTEIRMLLEKHPMFSKYSDAFYETLLENAKKVQVKAGQVLFYEGDEANYYLIVAEGAVEMFRYSIEGDERVFSIFEQGAVGAHAAMFMPHGRYPMNARARQDGLLYFLSRESLHKACFQFPALAMRLLSGLSMNMYQQINQVHLLTSSSAQERLAHYFIELTRAQGLQINIPLTQKQLAAQLGIRAETLNRLLGEWQQKNYIQGKRKEWTILDLDFLKSLTGGAKRGF